MDVVEKILKSNYIFNNILITFWSRIIKVSHKSDMAIIWLDIWDSQSDMNTRELINRYFNVGSFIATVWGMNPGVSQYKKCWKWDHSTHSYRVQGSKCVKYNRLQLTEHHQQFSWYCKANSKTNSSRLETKLGELCSYSLRCLNCKGDHQADSNLYLFWRHCFNKE